ncbi:MAG TPA: metalloregulator ArsR/SmtB family transcription factor [Thermoanaerobaculia bacterium]|nr:metalloregulator ArsR/SmtB family transcription factor [Thermoanaerobaculia bacterium]
MSRLRADTPRDDEAVWRALADSSRRRILDLLRERARTTGELAECFAFSRYAVMKHLKVLHEAGLLLIERRGRERINHLNAVPLQRIVRRWVRPFEAQAADRLLRLERHLAEE